MQLVLRQPWFRLSGLAAFLGLELKHNRGLDVILREERLESLSCWLCERSVGLNRIISNMLGEEKLPWR